MCTHSVPLVGTNVSHTLDPVDRLTAITDKRRPLSCAVVTKIWLPHTIGDEFARPGSGSFHFTGEVGLQRSTYEPLATRPCPDGPRQRGQKLAPGPVTSIIRTSPGARSAASATTPRISKARTRRLGMGLE